jgi:2-dehydropantoate 2-reductase
MSNEAPLKVVIFGAGAIGIYVGGSLAAHGNLVWFYDRPDMVKRISDQGVQIRQADGSSLFIERPNLGSDLGEILRSETFDCAIFSVKSYDTEALARQLLRYEKDIPPIVCLQNGVENEAVIQQILTSVLLIPGTVTTAIGKTDANEIIVEKLRGIGIAQVGKLSERIVAAMCHSGLNARLFANAEDMKWSKMLTNLTSNALSAILGMPPSEILDNPGLFRLEIEQLREILRVMGAYHINVVDLPGTPVRLFAWVVNHVPPSISKRILVRFIAKGRGAKMPSFYIDLASGRGKSEVEFLNGAVVRFGQRVNIQTPVNDFYTQMLMGLTEGRIARSEFHNHPEKIIHYFSNKGFLSE